MYFGSFSKFSGYGLQVLDVQVSKLRQKRSS